MYRNEHWNLDGIWPGGAPTLQSRSGNQARPEGATRFLLCNVTRPSRKNLTGERLVGKEGGIRTLGTGYPERCQNESGGAISTPPLQNNRQLTDCIISLQSRQTTSCRRPASGAPRCPSLPASPPPCTRWSAEAPRLRPHSEAPCERPGLPPICMKLISHASMEGQELLETCSRAQRSEKGYFSGS